MLACGFAETSRNHRLTLPASSESTCCLAVQSSTSSFKARIRSVAVYISMKTVMHTTNLLVSGRQRSTLSLPITSFMTLISAIRRNPIVRPRAAWSSEGHSSSMYPCSASRTLSLLTTAAPSYAWWSTATALLPLKLVERMSAVWLVVRPAFPSK